jgi:FSR family fosmidomycin resistance protein-like MFS transporter
MPNAARFALLVLLASSHGVNDFIAGALLGGNLPAATFSGRLPWLVVYAALAFAGQLPAAWVLERSPRPERWLGGSLILMIAAAGASRFSVGAAILLSGFASAICHVAGGVLAIALPRGERALGWFSAPGILGLTLGGFFAQAGADLFLPALLLPALLLIAWLGARHCWPVVAPRDRANPGPAVDAHDGLMLLLLLALTLRSALWDLVQLVGRPDPYVLFAVAASAAAGKVLGGWLYSRWQSPRQISVTLIVSCLLLDFARGHIVGLCAGVALLQSTIPASILHLHRTFGTTPARAVAYGLGATVAVGGLVAPIAPSLPMLAVAVATAGLLIFWRSLPRSRTLFPV